MALWLNLVVALACLGGLTSPGPVPYTTTLKELIEELDNITQKGPLCNGSMVWSVNLTVGSFCEAQESLANVSDCRAIYKTQKILTGLCSHSPQNIASQPIRDTKIEVTRFAKDLLQHARKQYRHPRPN